VLWEELSADKFRQACNKAKGVCILPLGVVEKHGTHLPLCTDMLIGRYIAEKAAQIETAVIFPYYYFGQILEARHVPGTISISPVLMYNLLDEVCSEIARNGLNKIIILNSHGGNNEFIKYFCQCSLYKKKNYTVYAVDAGVTTPEEHKLACSVLQTDDLGGHAGNSETSRVMAIRPELVDMDNVEEEGLKNLGRLKHLKDIYTGIGWYASHPTHFAGEPFKASPEAGREILSTLISRVARAVKLIKEDMVTQELQNEFFSKC